MASSNVSSISSSGRRTTQAQNRVIAAMQVLFLLMGIILILFGAVRISFDVDPLYDIYTKQIGIYFLEHPDSNILSGFFSALDNSSAEEEEDATVIDEGDAGDQVAGLAYFALLGYFNSVPFLIISSIIAIGGFGLIWCSVALGAKEPPAWHAGRNGLIALIGIMILVIIAISWGRLSLLRSVTPPAIVIIITAGVLFSQFTQPDYRLALGAERLQRDQRRNLVLLRNAILVVGLSTLIVLALVHAVLTDAIELPLGDVEPNELVFMTTFDDYNDEWDTFDDGRLIGEVATDDTGNHQFVLTKMPDEDKGFPFTLLNRKFRNFDMRVTITELASAPDHDNYLGVIFRYRSATEYYRFGISGDGYYRLDKVQPDPDNPNIVRTVRISDFIPTTDLTAATEPPYPTLIRPGRENPANSVSDTMNEIRVVGRDDQFWFYVNGEPVPLCLKGSRGNSMWIRDFQTGGSGCVEGNVPTYVFEDDDYKQGQIGFFADRTPSSGLDESGRPYTVSIAFDNVVIVGPPNEAPSTAFPSLPPTIVPPSIEIPE